WGMIRFFFPFLLLIMSWRKVRRSEGRGCVTADLCVSHCLTSIDRLSLLESLAPVAVEVIRLAIHQVVLSVGQGTGARAACEAARMPVTVECQQASVHQRVVAACTLGVELGSEADHAVREVVGNLVGLLDGSLAAVAAEVVGVPEAVDGHHRLVSHRRVTQRAQTTVRIVVSWLGHGWKRGRPHGTRANGW
ncbi:hypothetical protein PENTCL1PPCAC_5594, partial [Pristionchus entomophagus]